MTGQRRRAAAGSRLVSMLALAAAASGAQACHPPPGGPKDPASEGARLPAAAVSDEGFAEAVHRLLRHGEATPERSALLAGVVRRQLRHASALFAQGKEVRGTQAVVGAFYLLRAGEGRPDMFDPHSIEALRGAMKRFSARGDEGRAMALMLMLGEQLPAGSSERAELDRHVKSLNRWVAETRTGGDMARLAADERAAIGRALLQPSDDNIADAERAIHAWIDRAVEYNLTYQKTRKLPPRGEISEAYKALKAGAETMAALHLRFGRAAEALKAIEETAAGSVAEPEFFARIHAAAVDDTAEDWRLLARRFARLTLDEQDIDEALLEAALWGIAVEAYRRNPTSQAIGHLLAEQLVELEMPEVAPLVLRDALGPRPPTVALSAAMKKIAWTLALQLDAQTTSTARRIFAASKSVLELSDEAGQRGRVEPSAAMVRHLMAGIELRDGHAEAARGLLVTALGASPTVHGYRLLAAVERQMGELDAALGHVRKGSALPEAKELPLETAEAKLLEHEILLARGAAASQPLEEALQRVLATRKSADAAAEVRAERLLGHILDSYGDRQRASRAFERALELARGHRPSLSRTVLETVGRALVRSDVKAARAALQTGIKADIAREDLIYGALWLMFLERSLDETSDGKVERLLFDASDGQDWPATLARWARGRSDDAQLRGAAKSHAQRTEADFYIAMRARVRGEGGADEQLAEVARSPHVELMEVQIARDLLAPEASDMKLPEQYEQALSALD